MPFRYFIRLCYKGTNYHGWQIQPGASTIQETLNCKLSLLLKEKIYTIGAGRTDTGVHAPCFYAHFDSEKPDLISGKDSLLYHLNCILPKDIAVYDIYKVKSDAHARFSVLSRTYIYRISKIRDPFKEEITCYYSKNIDLELMNNAASLLLKYIDFTSFSKLHSGAKTNNCSIFAAYWTEEDNEFRFYIKADRFLRNMVRAIVGTLLEVGRARLSVEEFKRIIEIKDRSFAGSSAEAKGLHLISIEYPENIYENN